MSEKEANPKNSQGTKTSMKHGEEPTELLLALVWSPVETLRERGLAEIFVGDGRVAIIFANTSINPSVGLVPTLEKEKSVGSKD